MITIDYGNQRFNFRSAAVAVNKGRILLHQYEDFNFWAFPGGRVEIGEDTATSLIREIHEELGEQITKIELLTVNEGFFTHQDKEVHEICFYYLVEFEESSDLLKKTQAFQRREIDGSKLTFKWFPLEEVPSLEMYPIYIKEKIHELDLIPKHLITRE